MLWEVLKSHRIKYGVGQSCGEAIFLKMHKSWKLNWALHTSLPAQLSWFHDLIVKFRLYTRNTITGYATLLYHTAYLENCYLVSPLPEDTTELVLIHDRQLRPLNTQWKRGNQHQPNQWTRNGRSQNCKFCFSLDSPDLVKHWQTQGNSSISS